MTLWRLEFLRVVRTRRWVALAAVYVGFGLIGPLGAKYLAEILKLSGSGQDGVIITFPPPVPADGMASYVDNALQVGTIVAVVVAAGALAFDAIPEMGVFLRTRTTSLWQILVPRLVVSFAVCAAAFVLGTATAWYETWALLGPLDAAAVAWGTLLGILFTAFIIALVAAASQWTKGVLGTVLTSLVVLIVLPILGIVEGIRVWLPTRLGGALTELTAGTAVFGFWKSALAAVVAIAGLLALAARGARRREK
jgi:ABC-2 type transport system permease protein